IQGDEIRCPPLKMEVIVGVKLSKYQSENTAILNFMSLNIPKKLMAKHILIFQAKQNQGIGVITIVEQVNFSQVKCKIMVILIGILQL
ncbi:hypothetical protein, partial [Pasteurella multocida]|uniref:hypothetical protein n=1 Tax=Pasteurella multocida TaxID=747 RepID=UPI001B7D6835